MGKTKIQYPCVKHGTFLMQIYVLVQLKNKFIPLMLKDDVTVKGVLA
jgi:hypothetical protein